jgi:hypothetical protein
MRIRLNPALSREELTRQCPEPHKHDFWPDHRLRVTQTIALAREMGVPPVVADLSCGDAAIGRTLAPHKLILGDFAPGYEICGPIEETIGLIPSDVGMFILSETLEHLDDPDDMLAKIRLKADTLVLSTPIGETGNRNIEHYWGWDTADVHIMLTRAGWQPEYQCDVRYLSHPGSGWAPASYQLWGCR